MISRELELLREQWREVATDLNILFLAPYELPLSNGRAWEFAGLLPQFGGTRGMLIAARHSDTAFEAAAASGFGVTSMLPESHHLPVKASDYIECLVDWGWVGPGAPPEWYPDAA
jgi:hypothetical protein